MSRRTGVLLINLGTPSAPTVSAVRRYLRQFLSDPHVIDIPALLRWILVNAIILPFRTRQSTAAYQQIWTNQGSPLLVNSRALTAALRQHVGDHYRIALAMRYGKPDIVSAIHSLLAQQIETLILLPLYPQYAQSTTESSLQHAIQIIKRHKPSLKMQVIRDFYSDSCYLDAKSQLISDTIAKQSLVIDKFIFSYHGLPERHIRRVCHHQSCCNMKQPCPEIVTANQHCYRAQCYATSRQIADRLGWRRDQYLVTFQSRLGKAPWITPYTDVTLTQLAQQGVGNIALICPSFVCDCLETLEEIDIRAKEQWHRLGGQGFVRIPCLNDDSGWVKALAAIIER